MTTNSRRALYAPRPPQATLLLAEALLDDHKADPALRDRAWLLFPVPVPPLFHFDEYWVDDRNVFLRGFLFFPHQRTRALRYVVDGDACDIPREPRPDIAAHYPDCVDPAQAGFTVMIPFQPGAPIMLEADTHTGTARLAILLSGRARVSPTPIGSGPYDRFIARANRPGARILEIGSRLVVPGAQARGADFPAAAHFVGIDIHPGPGVDLVCDAHALSAVFRPASFDHVFSLSVLEHLPAPWRLPAQINHVLPIGGEVMHSVPFAWPVHEAPNDFWRFSDKGLELLFGPAEGFEIIDSGMGCEVRIVPEWRDALSDLPLRPGFCEAWIIARKVAETDHRRIPPPPSRTTSRAYPTHADDPHAPAWASG